MPLLQRIEMSFKFNLQFCRRGPTGGDFRGQKKRAPIVNTRNAKGAQGKRLWLSVRGIAGRLSGRHGRNLDDTISALPCCWHAPGRACGG